MQVASCVGKKPSGELQETVEVCITSLNKIRAHPHNFQLFAKLCEKNSDTFHQLFLRTKAR